MNAPIFAMPSPGTNLVQLIGLLLVLLIVATFVASTRAGGRRSVRARSAGFGILAIFCGPVVGAALAGLAHILGGVQPADVGYTYKVFSMIGGIAGLVAGNFFAIAGLVCSPDSTKPAAPRKPVDLADEI